MPTPSPASPASDAVASDAVASDAVALASIVLRGLAAEIDSADARGFARRGRRAPAPLALRMLDAFDLELTDNERDACRSVWQGGASPSRFWSYGSAVGKLGDAAAAFAAACDAVARDGHLQRLPLRSSGLPKPVWHALLERDVHRVDELDTIDDLMAVSGIGVVGAALIGTFVAALPAIAARLNDRLAALGELADAI